MSIAFFRRKNQVRRLNGAVNRVPTNLYDRVFKMLERTRGGIVISGHLLPQVSQKITIQEFSESHAKNHDPT